MRELVRDEPIVPLVDGALQLKDDYGVSMIIIAGGSSMYFRVADVVIKVSGYLPYDVTDEAKSLEAPGPCEPGDRLVVEDCRYLLPDNFDPRIVPIGTERTLPSGLNL